MSGGVMSLVDICMNDPAVAFYIGFVLGALCMIAVIWFAED